MPLDEKVLGFTNRWYQPAIETAETREIPPGVITRVISSPYFCATKPGAFDGRGANDYLASHDPEDIITVIDGRAEIMVEITRAPEGVREYISGKIAGLNETRQFPDALPGYLLPEDASQRRLRILYGPLNRNRGNELIERRLIPSDRFELKLEILICRKKYRRIRESKKEE